MSNELIYYLSWFRICFCTFIRMIEQVVDASAIGFIATPERKSVMDLAYFTWTEPQAMVVPLPGEEPRLFAFIKPFQPIVILCFYRHNQTVSLLTYICNDCADKCLIFYFFFKVWLLILIASFCVISSMSLFSKVYLKLIGKSVKNVNTSTIALISQYSVYVVNTLTNQGNNQDHTRLSFCSFLNHFKIV